MSSTDYVAEKLGIAVGCLCSKGSFKERLEMATIPALVVLEEDDLTGELAEDLKYVLGWTKNNIRNGEIIREPDELERGTLIEKMLHLLLETHRMERE